MQEEIVSKENHTCLKLKHKLNILHNNNNIQYTKLIKIEINTSAKMVIKGIMVVGTGPNQFFSPCVFSQEIGCRIY